MGMKCDFGRNPNQIYIMVQRPDLHTLCHTINTHLVFEETIFSPSPSVTAPQETRVMVGGGGTADGYPGLFPDGKTVKYGFIGIGIMGRGMAMNLVKKGFDVTVCMQPSIRVTGTKCSNNAWKQSRIPFLQKECRTDAEQVSVQRFF